jgi:hypothetical protein
MSGFTLPTAGFRANRLPVLGIAAVLALPLVGCADDADTGGTESSGSGAIRIVDPYVKAAAADSMAGMDGMEGMDGMSAMEPMSAAFMTIANDGPEAVTLTGGSTSAAAKVEIHEVVDGTMQPIAGGLVIAPGSTSVLQPGGNHVMLIGLTGSLDVGDEVALTLTFADAEPVAVTAPVKEIPGADEPYDASPSAG